jgi:hypothetical protein
MKATGDYSLWGCSEDRRTVYFFEDKRGFLTENHARQYFTECYIGSSYGFAVYRVESSVMA